MHTIRAFDQHDIFRLHHRKQIQSNLAVVLEAVTVDIRITVLYALHDMLCQIPDYDQLIDFPEGVNVYDALNAGKIILTKDAVAKIEEVLA